MREYDSGSFDGKLSGDRKVIYAKFDRSVRMKQAPVNDRRVGFWANQIRRTMAQGFPRFTHAEGRT